MNGGIIYLQKTLVDLLKAIIYSFLYRIINKSPFARALADWGIIFFSSFGDNANLKLTV